MTTANTMKILIALMVLLIAVGPEVVRWLR